MRRRRTVGSEEIDPNASRHAFGTRRV